MDNVSKIINFLGKNSTRLHTMHELSRLTNIPYATLYRTIAQMGDIITIDAIGRAKTVQLNTDHPVAKAHLAVASYEEEKEFLKNQPIIRKIVNELDTKDVIVLFGSYAKGKETEKSDIDLLIINKDGKKTVSFAKYELLYRKKINPIFVKRKEFELMLRQKEENVGKQALQNHIVLNNPEEFWGCALNAV
jgi:predicted nucleotidyltransferase